MQFKEIYGNDKLKLHVSCMRAKFPGCKAGKLKIGQSEILLNLGLEIRNSYSDGSNIKIEATGSRRIQIQLVYALNFSTREN